MTEEGRQQTSAQLGWFAVSAVCTTSIILLLALTIFRVEPEVDASGDYAATELLSTTVPAGPEPTSTATTSTSISTSPPTSSITSELAPPPPPPSPPPPDPPQTGVGYGFATCEPGFGLVAGGSTERGYDIVICADSGGAGIYHGINDETDLELRRPACRFGAGRFEAVNGGHRYIVDLDDLLLTVIGPAGNILVEDPFLGPLEYTPLPIRDC